MSHSSTAHTLDTFTLPQPIQADNVSDLSSVMFGALCLFSVLWMGSLCDWQSQRSLLRQINDKQQGATVKLKLLDSVLCMY